MRPLVLAAIAGLLLAQAKPVWACGVPGNYVTSVDGNTVRVFAMRPCSAGAGDVLLREDAVSGAAMRVDAACVDGWYVDTCVAPGTYRYGFETPYATTPDCECGPFEYFGVATVKTPLTCPSTDIGVNQVPWSTEQTICSPTTSCSDPTPGAPCETSTSNESANGCSVGAGASPPWWVLGVGLLLMRRRRIMR